VSCTLQAQPEKQVDRLFTSWNNAETPGAAIAVMKDGKIILKKGYGSADLEHDIPIRPSTVFHIASVSKQFTAYAVLLLERDGKLSLDDDIRKYIPEVPDFGKVITLRQLVHHTSGLRDQWNLLALAGWRLDDVITTDHIINIVSRERELNFDPGNEYLYCNTGFTLLAEVVARVSGKSFADFTRERIFTPLKMVNTLFYDDHEKIVKNRAYSFYPSGSGYKKSVLNYANVGATSLFTTVEDLCLWAGNFEDPVIGDKKLIAEMEEKGILNNGDTITYAMGQEVGIYKGLRFMSHAGGDAGYRTFLGRFPDQRFSVIVLSNDATFDPVGMALKIADIYLKDKYAAETNDESRVSGFENKPGVPDVDLLKSYCGKYELEQSLVVTVELENDKLSAEAPGYSKIFLDQMSSNEFKVKGMDAKVIFLKDDQGEVNQAKVVLKGRESIARKMKGFDPQDVDLSEFTGDFNSPELNTSYSFVLRDGILIARHFRIGDITLTPVDADNFKANKWFFGQVEFIRDDHNNIKGCRVSSGRVRNLWFDKLKE